MVKKYDSNAQRLKRHKRVRAHISGTAETPRLNVFRSDKHIYAQIIDDVAGKTLVAAATNEKDFGGYGGNVEAAKKLGGIIAERALKAGIENVVFDRGGYLYHGRVKALADGAREGGLKF
jgi:large subunit ribosomal protein L18